MIDIEKFICSLLADHPVGVTVREDIHKALKDQGLEYKGGKIVSIEDKISLPESEDERIRKELLVYLKERDYDVEDEWIAWLEKRSEQKSTDKFEPKFKVGDWITNGAANPAQISSIKNGVYFTHNDTIGGDIESIDKQYHLWTIQDAKDGDVLFQDLMSGKTFIYNGVNSDMAILYSFIISNDGEDVLPYHIGKPNTGIGNIEENKNIIYPATKEQRNLLSQKMKEAGYEWDVEKKELKKVGQKPAENKGMNLVEEEMTPFQKKVFCIIDTAIEEEQGLKQVCNELLALASNENKKKPTSWNEEDEKIFSRICGIIHHAAYQNCDVDEDGEELGEYARIINWFKSLKERYAWKPSDEQMNTLEYYMHNLVCTKHKEILFGLYSDLKKLKE